MNLKRISTAVQDAFEVLTDIGEQESVADNFTVEASFRSGNDDVVVEVRLVLSKPSLPDLPAEPTDHENPDIKF